MKTKFIAIFAVLAMVFVGAAVIAEDNASDAVTTFDVDSPIDAYARSTDVSHAIHYNTTGGMLTIVLSDADYGTLKTPDIAVQVTKDAGTPTVYDPVSKAKEIHLNIGDLGSTSTVVKVAVHGSTFASGTIDFTLGAFSTTTINYVTAITENVTATNGNLENGVCTPNTTARNLEVSFTQTPAVNSFIGWAVSAEAAAAKTVAISSGASLETVLMGATLETATYKVYAVWSNDSFTLNYNFNLPAMITTTRYVNTTSASTIGTAEAQAAFMTTGVLKPATLLVGGTDYVPSDYNTETSGTQSIYLAGYTFAGWWTSQTGGTEAQTSGTSIQAAFTTANLAKGGTYTLYAHWTVSDVTVTYSLGTSGQGFDYTPVSPTWNTQTVQYDSYGKLLTLAGLTSQATTVGGTLAVTTGYVFSHWKISSTSYNEGEGFDVTALDSTFTGAITVTPVFDYKVTVSGLINGLDFQPQERTVAGYEMLVDGDLTGADAKYKFKVAFDNLLISVSDIKVNTVSIKSGNPAALPAYEDGITYEITNIAAPQAIAITAEAEYFSVTVNSDTDGEVALTDAYSGVSINWTKVVPKSKEGLLTIASSAVGTSSYVYNVTAADLTNFEIVKVSNNVYKIKQKATGAMTLAITVSAAAAAHDNVYDMSFNMDSINTSAATAYLRANSYEVPAGAIVVEGTAYKTEGGVTTYTALPYNSYTSKGVAVAGDHDGTLVDGKEPGTGYEEYQITVASPDGYTLYAAKMTFTPTGGSSISTVYAI
ncbi:MAG: hypothetical protein II933_02840 [Candidatus Methanomethylophilaceae archaeon]|nr:hypothetical protein [Candidatus Methanomethylophilaceae archaeon]